MKYKVTGNMHLWAWTELRDEIKGQLIEYEFNGTKLVNQTIEVAGTIDSIENLKSKYNVKFEEVI